MFTAGFYLALVWMLEGWEAGKPGGWKAEMRGWHNPGGPSVQRYNQLPFEFRWGGAICYQL